MVTRLRPFQLLTVSFVIAVFILCLLTALPHAPYIRYQQLASESLHYQRAKWIYERIHFDTTPIDIAFIGTSHTQSGINSALVEATLTAHGDGRKVVNFAVPHLGRDLQYLVGRELLNSRKVDTLVIEVQQTESRAPHPGFQRLADVSDILVTPIFINTGVVDNLARLPMRQRDLFLKTIWPNWFGFTTVFNPKNYDGAHFDDTYRLHGTVTPRTDIHPRSYFEKDLKKIRDEIKQKEQLAKKVEIDFISDNPLYRYNNIYFRDLLTLAEQHSVKVVFMYLPFLGADPEPDNRDLLEGRGRLVLPTTILTDEKLWQNADHLNFYGAQVLSLSLANSLAR